MVVNKKIKLKDIINIEKIGKESLPIYFTKKDIFHLLLDNNYAIFKATNNHKIVGFCICQIYPDRIHIMSIAISKKFRKKGYASELINNIINLNYKKVSLYVIFNNIPAIKDASQEIQLLDPLKYLKALELAAKKYNWENQEKVLYKRRFKL